MLTHEASIRGTTWTFFRVAPDQPNAEVVAQMGEHQPSKRPQAWINTQYGVVQPAFDEDLARALVAGARAYQKLRFAAEKAAEKAQQAARTAAPIAPGKPRVDPAVVWVGQESMDAEDSIF